MTIMIMMIMADPFTTNLVVKGTVVKGSVVKGAHPMMMMMMMIKTSTHLRLVLRVQRGSGFIKNKDARAP